MKFVVIGSALSGNKGAAAMLESTLQALGKDNEFTLLSMYPEEDRAQNPYPNLAVVDATPLQLGLVINPLALLWKLLPFLRSVFEHNPAIKALSQADALLDQGGITFVDGREKFLIYNLASILPAIFMKVPVAKCAQALGPFNNPINRWAAKTFLPKMALIVSRGAITHQHLASLGLKNVKAGADYAFSLELTEKEIASAQQKVAMGFFDGEPVVGVSPSVVLRKKAEAAGKDYVKITADFIDWLISKEGYKVALIPHSVRMNTEKKHNNDLPLCREIFAALKNKKGCLFIDKELSSQELRYVIGKCDIFVASRFHAMVSSLAMEVPTLVIGWSHKYKEVLDMFGAGEWAFNSNDLESQYLQKKFLALKNEQKAVKAQLAKHLGAVKKTSRDSITALKQVHG